RCLLTGALVFVLPNTAGQAAGASVFAFVGLLGFELLRPHLSHTDAWMYRIGCITIFFSNFLGLMAKADVSDEEAQSQEAYGLLLIAVHVLMVLAILAQAYVSMQANSELRDDLGSWLEKSNQNAPPADVAANGGRGDGDGDSIGSPVFSAQRNAGGWGEKQEEAAEAAGACDGVAMWKHDRVGEAGGDDRAERGSSVGWEDVERPRRARGRRHKKDSCRSGGSSSADQDGDDDVIMEDSVELESVYSTSGKTSLIAGAFGLPHRRRHGRALSSSSVGLSSIDDSFLSSFASGST
ncbi:unnamed protein product, partial [Ectocarpus sp. 12 AP-2014]